MSGNELLGIAFPLAAAVLLVGLGLTGSRLSAPHRKIVEHFVFLPLLALAVIGLGIEACVERHWAGVLWLLPCVLAIPRIWRRRSSERRDNPGGA